jgi:hypothetical protein
MTFEQISAVSSLLTSIFATAIAIAALVSQRGQSSINLQANLLLELHREFFHDSHMKTTRFRAAQCWFDEAQKVGDCPREIPTAPGHVIDFFDIVATYYNRGALDKEMTFVTFYYWIEHYWTAFGPGIAAFEEKNEINIYVNIVNMLGSLRKVGVRLKRIPDKLRPSTETMNDFFKTEMEECG